jgi:hypothetical protein
MPRPSASAAMVTRTTEKVDGGHGVGPRNPRWTSSTQIEFVDDEIGRRSIDPTIGKIGL